MPEPACIYCANGDHEVCIQTHFDVFLDPPQQCSCPCHHTAPIQEYQFGLEVQ